MKWKKGLSILLAAGMVLAVGCVQAYEEETDPVELSILYSGGDVTWVAAMEKLCKEFMAEHPEIIIYTENANFASCEEELKVKEALDEFPDIFELENISLFAEAGRLCALDEQISSLLANPIKVDGTVYGLPTYAVTNGIIYNKEIFKKYNVEIPASYSEFLAVCEKLKKNGVMPLALGGNREECMIYWLDYFFQKEVISQIPDWQERRMDGQVSFTDEEPMRMLQEFQELVTSDYIMEESIHMTENQLAARMVKDEFAMLYAGPWMFSKIINAYPEATSSDKTNLGVDIPQEMDPVKYRINWFFIGDDQGEVTALTQNKSYWAVSQECAEDEEKYAAVTAFLQFFYQKEHYRETLQELYGLPVTSTAIIYPGPPAQQRLLTDYRYARKSQQHLGSYRMSGEFLYQTNELMMEIYNGIVSVEEAAKQMDIIWDETMRRDG